MITVRDVQTMLAKGEVYTGGIDGIAGPKTIAAVEKVLEDKGRRWSKKRKIIGAAQTILNFAGFEAGTVDGYAGHNTMNAFSQWQYFLIHGKHEVVERTPSVSLKPTKIDIPHQRDVSSFYGRPGAEIKSRLTTIELPFSVRIDWNLRQKTSRIRVHEKCADNLKSALIKVHDHYGTEQMRELGIDRYAGAYNHRKMRGGSKYSMHAYGCAIDFYAAPNGLRMRCPQALFCGSDYREFLDIMEEHGWLPALRLWGADAMHFQAATL